MQTSFLAAILAGATLLAAIHPARAEGPPPQGGYVVVVSDATYRGAEWRKVVVALVKKHSAGVLVYEKSVEQVLGGLRERFPKHVCFVATPGEASRDYVARVHRLMRRLDDDPYTDALWGILTGYDAACALRIAEATGPLVVRRVAAGTEVELACCEEGVWYCELNKNRMVRKAPGKEPKQEKCPDDTTRPLADALTDYKAQLVVTSGHATERDWQIGYRYRSGQFRSEAGKLFGVDVGGVRFPIVAPEPKVYLPVGNCLMGHVDGPDAMALAWMNSAGVCQMIGYTVPTWYGYAGWGLLDYFVEQPGRFTLAEAFHANHQALVHRLETHFPGASRIEEGTSRGAAAKLEVTEQARKAGLSAQDAAGLLFDRDVVAFYGDPAWQARMAPGPLAWQQRFEEKDGVYQFEITPKRGGKTFAPVNTNGSQRGGRPVFQYLPHRVKDVEIVEGAELRPLITDDFLLIPNPGPCDPARAYRVVFRAARAGPRGPRQNSPIRSGRRPDAV